MQLFIYEYMSTEKDTKEGSAGCYWEGEKKSGREEGEERRR